MKHSFPHDALPICGALTIQNGIPCPKGSKQEVQVVESPMVIPNYESPPPIVTEVPELEPAPKPQAPAVERPQAPQPEQLADADRLPPPTLYQANTWDRSEARRGGKRGGKRGRTRGAQ